MNSALSPAILLLCSTILLLSKPIQAVTAQPLLQGIIVDRRGAPLRNADICLYRAGFTAFGGKTLQSFPQGASRCRKSDRDGRYELYLADRTTYVLLARKKSLWSMRVLVPGATGDTLQSRDTLIAPGTLRFPVRCENAQDHQVQVALAGTPFVYSGTAAGTVEISGVPQGTYAAIIRSLRQGYRTVQCSLRIRSAQTDVFTDTLRVPRESAAWVPEKPVMVATTPAVPPKPTPVPKKPAPAKQTDTVARPTVQPAQTPVNKENSAEVPKRTFQKPAGKPPVVTAPADTFIGIFDTLTLSGTATDDGQVVRMEWDIGATGKFIATGDGKIELPPFKAPVSYLKCIFRATDNEGLSATDTMFIHAALLWMSISPPKELLGRNGHSLVAFNNDLLIIGGNRSDVWSSTDGISWTLITDAAPFGKLFGHTTTVFNNALWIVGGKTGPKTFSNGVWTSSTGALWKKAATLPFDKRVYHSAVTFHGKLWIIGGLCDSETDPFLNDIWSSSDGINWTLVTKNAPFAPRYGHASVVFNNKLYVLGGFNDAVGSPQSFNDVWESADGATWTCTNKAAPFSKDRYHCALAFDNKLWMVGGYDNESGTDRFTDILYTANGTTWTNLTENLTGGNRFFCAAVPLGNRILVSPSDSHKLWIMR
jgi:hypothetical protein